MSIYVGIKPVRAEKMNEAEFAESKGLTWPKHKIADLGYKVIYDNGYESWSPKEVFEKFYFKIEDLSKLHMLDIVNFCKNVPSKKYGSICGG